MNALAQTRITKPVQHKECPLDATHLSQRFGKSILFWVTGFEVQWDKNLH